MSDFLTELRAEVLDAHAAQRRRGRARRTVRALVFSPRPALTVATTVVTLVVAALAIRAVTPPPAGSPRVIDVIRLGGEPTDAAAAGGSVWVADFAGRQIVRLEPGRRRVVTRVRVAGQPVAVAAGPNGVWFRTAVGDAGEVSRIGGGPPAQVGYGTALAAGSTTVWAADVELAPEGIHRIDAARGRDTGLLDIPVVHALAVGGEALWAVTGNGTVLRLDGRTGRVRARWPAIAISAGTEPHAIVADARGAWVLRTGQGADSHAIRLEGDRVVRRLPIGPSVLPLLAQAPDGLWVITEEVARRRHAALRLDPESGEANARVDLGGRNPRALVAVEDDLWILSGDGTVTVVGE